MNLLKHFIVFSCLNFLILCEETFKVEARPKEVIPVPGWFNNVEGFILPNLQAFQSTEPNYINRHIETDELLGPFRKKNNKKKRKRIIKKLAKKFEANKTLKKKKGSRLKFIKSDVIKGDINDSNLSVSKEKQSKGKPVDIIVHIKMKE